jgi:hypothetical protein
MSTEFETLPKLDVWRPMLLQLVLFPTSPNAGDQKWWEGVTGQEPAESNRKGLERTDSGVLPDCALSVSIDPLKISWTMMPRTDSEELLATAPLTLRPFPESAERFVALMSPWLSDQCPPIKRLGFAGSLIQDSPSHPDAYRLLGCYLPAVKVDPNSYDFQYRINRKRPSKIVQGLSINRLTLWSALKVSSFVQTVRLGEEPQAAPTIIGPSRFAAMVAFDVNSDGERPDDLPPLTRMDLFRELNTMAKEIAAFGDKP